MPVVRLAAWLCVISLLCGVASAVGTATPDPHCCARCHHGLTGRGAHTRRPHRQQQQQQHQQQQPSDPARPFRVLYVGKGHYFQFVEPALARVLRPRPVTFHRDDDDEHGLASTAAPDLVVLSVDTASPAALHGDYGRARVLGCVAEPTTDTAAVAAFGEASAARGRPVLVLSTVARHAVLPFVRYYPSWAMSMATRRHASAADLVARKTPAAVASAVRAKTHFACFMYSHASPGRDRLFDVLTDGYKAVTPLGAAKQDRRQAWMPAPALDRGVRNDTLTYNDLAVDRYRACKFVVAGESWMLDGYITEKLVNAMLANAVPIYWGPPDVAHTFNPASFIDARALSEEDLVAEVRRLDQDDAAYAAKLMEPWFVGGVLPAWLDASLQDTLAAWVRGGH